MPKCPVCEQPFDSYQKLGMHFSLSSDRNDAQHIMWLNRNITREKQSPEALSELLQAFFVVEGIGLGAWIKKRFIQRFYGRRPHPFILALQRPSKAVILGYVLEHQHFLRQWVKSLSWIVIKTNSDEVMHMELENVATEFIGYGKAQPSHYELLVRMGESLGLARKGMLSTPPLPDTASALETWSDIAQRRHWVETMAAMHGLELVANRDIKKDGAVMTYFDPVILGSDEITEATKAFLREGYEADVEHSEVPVEFVEKYAAEFKIREDVQITFLRSIEAFDRYLTARLERGMQFDPTLARYVLEAMRS